MKTKKSTCIFKSLLFSLLLISVMPTFAQQSLFDEVTKRDNAVFIKTQDKGSLIHATNAIEAWGYWQVTTDENQADFILKFSYITCAFGDKKGYAIFIDKTTGEALRETKKVNTGMSMDVNTKRGVITKVVNKRIKKMFK